MHGHQMRRAAQIDRTEMWSEVKPGALYQALHRMEEDGTIESVYVEQQDNRPVRTVYQITEEGKQELAALRNVALRSFRLRPDPVDLAVQNLDGMPEEQVRTVLIDRRNQIVNQQATWEHMRDTAWDNLRPIERAIVQHSLARLSAELRWHDEFIRQLPKLLREEEADGEAPGNGQSA